RMSHHSTLPVPPSLIDLDATFLPVAQMRQIARVTALEGGRIEGEVDLGPEHWVWEQHFPGDPIFPGTLLIEAAGQLIALWAWSQGQRGRPRLVRTSAEFHSPVGQWAPSLLLKGDVRRKRHLNFGSVQIVSEGTLVATVEAVLVVLPPS
ncbi:MAG: 3-hydroxyacyl-ACP dehydratase FabZ family protein, partial [Gemmatimonadales bacterium]